MARVGRPIFKRHEIYVALRRIRLSTDDYLEPGDVVDLPTYRLKHLYNRRRIGPRGHPWTEQALAVGDGYPKAFTTDDPYADFRLKSQGNVWSDIEEADDGRSA